MELELLRQISQFGLLGVILALVIWIAVQLWKDLKVSWLDRIHDNRNLVAVIEATNRTYSELATATENRARASEAMAHAQQATATALEAQAKMMARVADGNEGLTRTLDRMAIHIEALNKEMEKLGGLIDTEFKTRKR